MSGIEQVVRTPAAQALGQALAHSIWQGGVAALALAPVLWLARSARLRYASACLALLLMAVAFAFTVARSIPPDGVPRLSIPAREPHTPPDSAGTPLFPSGNAAGVLPWLAPFWALGVLAFHLRALVAWTATRRLRTVGVCAAPAVWLERLEELRARVRVSRPVVLLESSLAKAPVLAGHARPVILMPVGLMAGLPTAQVEAVLLHELAHICRQDYLINMFQTWVEAIFFYHPAAWWLSSVIRAEREHCCDDAVVAIQGDPRQYATALAALEEYRWSAAPAVAATGGNLLKRIRRLLQSPEGPRSAVAPVLSATLIALAGAAALIAWQARPAERPQSATVSPYTKWVNEDVTYIIDDRERAAFASVQTDEEREKFIEQFWLRRDPTPRTLANEMKEEHYRRIGYANDRYAAGIPGWKTDRGRRYIVSGPADEIEAHPAGGGANGLGYPYEVWHYRDGDKWYLFVDRTRSGEYRFSPEIPIRR
ncbi:MAG: peptidase BlaR1 [Thermomicrobiales bacterium]|jgi:GWxTD domain-containing protein|nr:peptidase BlaR1 [Thermomicrobiales bacterium]